MIVAIYGCIKKRAPPKRIGLLKMTQRYLLAIGGNLPLKGISSNDLIQSAVDRLSSRFGKIDRLSHWYRTTAIPVGNGPDYINGAAQITNNLNPNDFLSALHEIERDFGRERNQRWGPRTLDLDLIAADDSIFPDKLTWQYWFNLDPARQMVETPHELILPHPRMQNRAFALVPLMDIAAEWRHPVLGRTIAEMHADLTEEDLETVRLLPDSGCQ